MINYLKNMVAVGFLIVFVPLGAYYYEFKNWLGKAIEFQFMLVGGIDEPIETITIPAARMENMTPSQGYLPQWIPGEASRGFKGSRGILCTNTSTFNVRVLPDGKFKKPILTNYSSFIDIRNHQISDRRCLGGERWATGEPKCPDQALTCDSTIEINMTTDGDFVVWLSSQL